MIPLRATVKGDTLTTQTFACSRCHQGSPQAGSGWIRVRGMRVHVCAANLSRATRAHLPEVA
jgi:hypothetical protein